MVPTIRVAANPEELAWMAAERLVVAAEDAIVATGRFVLALSGGSTPQVLFKTLASDAFIDKIDWAKVHVLFVDERCVPADHKDSNFGMACRTLLDHVDVPYENIHRMAGEKDPAQAAAEYDQLLSQHYSRGVDLLLLGMGEDGHTASLFPGTAALDVKDRLAVANFVPKFNSRRLTMTLPYLNRAFETLVLIAGKSKAAMASQVLEGIGQAPQYPIQLIQPATGKLVWMMDAEAAAMDQDDTDEPSSEMDKDQEGSD